MRTLLFNFFSLVRCFQINVDHSVTNSDDSFQFENFNHCNPRPNTALFTLNIEHELLKPDLPAHGTGALSSKTERDSCTSINCPQSARSSSAQFLQRQRSQRLQTRKASQCSHKVISYTRGRFSFRMVQPTKLPLHIRAMD